jgi:hypothetical protein
MRTEYKLTVWLTENDMKRTASNGGIAVPVQPGTTEVLIRRDGVEQAAEELRSAIRGE